LGKDGRTSGEQEEQMNKENQKIRISTKFYRRSPNSKTHIFNENHKAGDIYYEFEETWEKPRGDEGGKHKQRLIQTPTGRRFRYVDNVTNELVEDTKKYEHRDVLKGYLILVTQDFMYCRLKQI
jgi:hypothetical protein